jgi:hypothetical protein
MESDAPRGALRDIGSMGDDYDRGAIAMKFLEQRQDFFAGIAVKCPRRLVCQKKCRTVYKRASDGNTLLLPARELIGPMVLSMTQSDAI